MNKFVYDTEFIETGPRSPIGLISIGVVHPESGRTYYAINADMNQTSVKRHKWLKANVWPTLPLTKHRDGAKKCRCMDGHLDLEDPSVKPREIIAAEVAVFVATLGSPKREENELWAYFAAYDHVVLSQLYGTMKELPGCMPMFTRDLKDAAVRAGNPELPAQSSTEHHALADAEWNVEVAKFLGVL